ncbi:MAG TPA: DUF1003 domain-containing protein [Candidatus Cloacimonadota bacterium]|nr:DUF1003 domain-containing protein [Candidatus Cloacimonadota bacterium]HPT72436.1 DUF1003 domain-containing protein [Candidatus Cloacimonadota bacterium]
MKDTRDMILDILKKSQESLTTAEKHVLGHISRKEPISIDSRAASAEKLTFGQKVADKVATFGGSWPFIGLFALFLGCWIATNAYMILHYKHTFDPYPYILLNLILSMLAAIQAPVIMMSQNRQSAHDRADAAHDYEVNLKSELEIMTLTQKIDELREQKWEELLSIQKEQLDRLEQILQRGEGIIKS